VNDDPDDFSLTPDEMLCPGQEFSTLLVQDGLRRGDLDPLAKHLRNGFPISPEMASMIADAIEGQAGALCALSASRLSAGNPHTGIENIHTRNITIGRAYEVARQKLPRGQAANIKHTLAVRYRVSEVTVREAVVYTRRWLKSMSNG
jgi:hypothetical protein